MPRYVILRHDLPAQDGRGLHWDLMLETDGRLKTWALGAEPGSAASIPATLLADHRLEYLVYEGPVSNGRGKVAQWDQGSYDICQWDEDRIVVMLAGQRSQYHITCLHVEHASWQIDFDKHER